MKKLSFIGFLLALPTAVVTFFWIVTIGWFDWVDGMRCGGSLIANIIMVLASIVVVFGTDDQDIAVWTDSWKDHRAPSKDDLKAREILNKYNV